MKNFPYAIKNTAMIILAVILTSSSAFATVFTAVASGSWTSGSTWGGTAPSTTVTSDQISIPLGYTVSISSNVSINGPAAALSIAGSLTDSGTDTLTFGQGDVTGTGSITVNSLVLNANSSMVFGGTITVQNMTNWSAGVALTANTTINQSLNLAGGLLTLQTGGALTLATNSNIVLSGGAFTRAAGTLTLSNSYNVAYIDTSAIAGAELNGAGLNNLTINVPSGSNVSLIADLTVGGTLSLANGSLVLNGHNLRLNGDIASGGSGSLTAGSSSNLTINTTGSPSGSLRFTAGSDAINNLNIGIGNNGTYTLDSDLWVNGTLNFTSGMLSTGAYGLHIGASGSITGASSTSYIIATGGGYVSMQLAAGSGNWATFAVGSTIHYSPVAAELNNGSASGAVNVSVSDNVYSMGTAGSGANLSLTQPSVAMTYFVEPDSNTSSNVNLRLMWSASMEVNGFSRDSAYISHYTNSAWDISAMGSATSQGSLYYMERDNITTFSPFAVFGQNASTTGITAITADNFVVYPNPVEDQLVVKNIANGDAYDVIITDVAGQNVASYRLTNANNTISVAGLTDGDYFIRLTNDNSTVVKKFVKM